MGNKNIQFDVSSLARTLNQEQLGLLIDSMVELYIATYGDEEINLEPSKPEYGVEDVSLATVYLKKFQL